MPMCAPRCNEIQRFDDGLSLKECVEALLLLCAYCCRCCGRTTARPCTPFHPAQSIIGLLPRKGQAPNGQRLGWPTKACYSYHGTRNRLLSGERLPCIFVLHHFQDCTFSSEYVGGRGLPIAVISHGVIIVDAQRFEVLDKAAL